jgi:hypothetical protein
VQSQIYYLLCPPGHHPDLQWGAEVSVCVCVCVCVCVSVRDLDVKGTASKDFLSPLSSMTNEDLVLEHWR